MNLNAHIAACQALVAADAANGELMVFIPRIGTMPVRHHCLHGLSEGYITHLEGGDYICLANDQESNAILLW